MPDNSAAMDSGAVNVSFQEQSNDNRLTDSVLLNSEKQSTKLDTQDLQSNSNNNRLTDNVSHTNTRGKNKVKMTFCEYQPCGKEFIQTVSWKRFCCDDCRVANWELTHGTKLKKGKKQ